MAKYDLDPNSDVKRRYVVNTSAGVFHRTQCDNESCYHNVNAVAPAYRGYSDSAEALMAQGYIPCPSCCHEHLQAYRKGVKPKKHEAYTVG